MENHRLNYMNGGCVTCRFAERDNRNRFVTMCAGYSNCSYEKFEGEVDISEEAKDAKIKELERRLANSIELPQGLDVGRPVYLVYQDYEEVNGSYYRIDLGFVQWIRKKFSAKDNMCFYNFLVKYKSGLTCRHSFDDIGFSVFTTKAQARIRLRELTKEMDR